jgi:hypothetical protein
MKNMRYVRADIHSRQPDMRYDLVVFSFWL